jgi:hypothetical protein
VKTTQRLKSQAQFGAGDSAGRAVPSKYNSSLQRLSSEAITKPCSSASAISFFSVSDGDCAPVGLPGEQRKRICSKLPDLRHGVEIRIEPLGQAGAGSAAWRRPERCAFVDLIERSVYHQRVATVHDVCGKCEQSVSPRR